MEFDKAILLNKTIESVVFDNLDISEYHLHEVSFHNCSFNFCNFDTARIVSSSFINCIFSDCSLQDTVFNECSFSNEYESNGCRWTSINLTDAKFNKCNLSYNIMNRGQAFRVWFDECRAVGMQFSLEIYRQTKKRVGNACFSHCAMMFSKFNAGDYRNCVFEHCDLRDSNFSDSNCSYASFFSSNINNALFFNTNLDAANLARAQIEGFELTDLASYTDITFSRDQHEQVLKSLSIRTFD